MSIALFYPQLMDQTTRPKGCYSTTEMTVLSCLCSPIDVGSWREGGGKNLTTSASPSEMDSCGPEEVGAALSTPSPPGEVEERGRVPPSEKKEVRERLPLSAKPVPLSSQPKLQPPSVPAQPKLNGGQQAPAGVPPQFHPQFRGMMPPYVSDGLIIDFTWYSFIMPAYLIMFLIEHDCFPAYGPFTNKQNIVKY